MSYEMTYLSEERHNPDPRLMPHATGRHVWGNTPIVLDRMAQRPSQPKPVEDHPDEIKAILGPYQLRMKLTPSAQRPYMLLFDSTLQHRDGTPATDCIFVLQVTPASNAGQIVYGLVSLADESSGYHHIDAIRLAGYSHYQLTASVCGPDGAGGTISVPWVHPTPVGL